MLSIIASMDYELSGLREKLEAGVDDPARLADAEDVAVGHERAELESGDDGVWWHRKH